MLDGVVAETPDQEAVVADDRRMTYGELRSAAIEFARGLIAEGVGKGDHVGILLPNRAEWVIANYGIQYVGATLVGLNTWYQREELSYALTKADVSTLVTTESFAGNRYLEIIETEAPEIANGTLGGPNSDAFPHLQRVITVDGGPSWTLDWEEVLESGQAISQSRIAAAADTVTPTDAAYILFSSGTTGKPKAIVIEHDALVTNGRSMGARMDIDREDRFWAPLPLFFSFASCHMALNAHYHGATLVLQAGSDPETAADLIETEGCTVLYGMADMLRKLEDLDRDLTVVFDDSETMIAVAPADLRERFEREHGIGTVLTGYGLTEGICCITSHRAPLEARLHTTGQPLANIDVRIKDFETGEEVAPDEEGEICINPRTIFREYYGDPIKTRNAFDAEGYFHTGDVGCLTADGRLVFLGRDKDLIKPGGITVSPREVENVLERHPDVRTAAVYGAPHGEKDEAVIAELVARDTELDEASVDEFVCDHLSSYKIPEVYRIHVEEFPRTGSGKIKKVDLREQYLAELDEEATE